MAAVPAPGEIAPLPLCGVAEGWLPLQFGPVTQPGTWRRGVVDVVFELGVVPGRGAGVVPTPGVPPPACGTLFTVPVPGWGMAEPVSGVTPGMVLLGALVEPLDPLDEPVEPPADPPALPPPPPAPCARAAGAEIATMAAVNPAKSSLRMVTSSEG